jgi:hypothetical protein
MAVLGIAAILQPLLGSILDAHWQGVLVGGARIYPAEAYSAAFLWLTLCAAVSVLMVAFTRESYCKMAEH